MCPALRASGPRPGVPKTRSAPSIRRCRCAGWWSSRASAVITESTGDGAGVVADHERAAGRPGCCSQAGRLHPEPLLVQRAERRGEHVLGEVAVEAELVHLVVAGDPPAQERQPAGDPPLPLGALGGDVSRLDRVARLRRVRGRVPGRLGSGGGRHPRSGRLGRAAGTSARRLVAVQRDHPGVTHDRPPPRRATVSSALEHPLLDPLDRGRLREPAAAGGRARSRRTPPPSCSAARTRTPRRSRVVSTTRPNSRNRTCSGEKSTSPVRRTARPTSCTAGAAHRHRPAARPGGSAGTAAARRCRRR